MGSINDVADQILPGTITFVCGTDLYRRCRFLQKFAGYECSEVEAAAFRPSAYIGPEIYNAISSLAPTVREELSLASDPQAEPILHQVARRLGLDQLMQRNPFTLSGGEQAFLVILSAAGQKVQRLGIEGALEQVSPDSRVPLLDFLQGEVLDRTSVALADNRFTEYDWAPSAIVDVDSLDATVDPRFTSDEICPVDPLPPSQIPGKLILRNVQFGYRPREPVLQDIDAELQPGDIYLLAGNNGAGKSTLAKLMCGVLEPDVGTVSTVSPNGHMTRTWDSPGRLVTYHFQNPDLQFVENTIGDEVAAGVKVLESDENAAQHRVEQMISAFRLSAVRDLHPLELDLPFFIRKRVALAATLAPGHGWVILDEPTLGQDDRSARSLAAMIQKMAAIGVGIILISHSLWFRNQFDYKLLKLENGRLTTQSDS